MIATRQPAPNSINDNVALPPKVPELPEDVFERFPSLREWQQQQNRWWTRTSSAIQQFAGSVGDEMDEEDDGLGDLIVQFNEFTAAITTQVDAIATEQGAQARRIVSVSAIAGLAQSIKVQATAPVSPAPVLNDYWVNNNVPTLPVTYQWDGAAWVEVTTPISAAAVAAEQTARVTADGFLEGKYTLTVVAGDVVTGMNITSSSGSGTNVSQVTFQADKFLIYSGTAAKVMFVADGGQDKVRIAGVLTVDGSATSVYVRTAAGAGSYNDASTFWFVDAAGRMSLKQKFLWDGSNLTIDGSGTFTGSITATSGTIGGWILSSTTLSKNNAILDSAGQLVLGTSNDVVYLSATDATYRIWIGNATAGSASFRVTKAGIMTATSGVFTGTITSTAGTIGGFTLGASSLSAGSGSTLISLSNDSGTGLKVGDPTASYGWFRRSAVTGSIGFLAFNTSNILVASLGTAGPASHGALILTNSAGTTTVSLDGSTGVVTATTFSGAYSGSGASLTSLNASNISSGTLDAARLPGGANGSWAVGGGSGSPIYAASGRLYFAASGNRWFVSDSTGDLVAVASYAIKKESSDGWTVKLNDGSATIEFQASGSQIYGRINGGSAVLLG